MPDNNRINKIRLTIPLCLLLAFVFIVFLPCLNNGFVNWDDDKYIINNPVIQAASQMNLKKIFTSFIIQNYHPITLLSYLFEYHFFQLNPFYYHLTNLILHLLNCALVFWLIFIISGRAYVAGAAAILFGIHPLQVESVAWISERKNLLYAFFFLGALISYCYYIRKEKALKYYCFSLVLFILSLLSKLMSLSLPLVLFSLDYIFRRKPDKSLLIEKIPYFILSLVFSIVEILCVHMSGILRSEHSYGLFQIWKLSSYCICFYLSKIFLPVKLSCFYPYSKAYNSPVYFFAIIIVILLFISIVISGRRTRKIIFGSCFFLAAILPVLQFVQTGSVIVTDRYSYIPSIGIFYIIAAAIFWFYNNKFKGYKMRFIFLTAVISVVAALSFLTWNRCKVWENSFVLWDDVINKYSAEYIPTAYFNRGLALAYNQENDKSISDLDKALMFYYGKLAIKQDYSEIYKRLLMSNYGHSAVYDFLGVKLAEIGRMEEAAILLSWAVHFSPSNIQAYYNLCSVYGNMKKYKEAIVVGSEVISLDPQSAQAHYNLAAAYFLDEQYALACRHNKMAVEFGFKPEDDLLKIYEKCGQ